MGTAIISQKHPHRAACMPALRQLEQRRDAAYRHLLKAWLHPLVVREIVMLVRHY
ncbi:MAG: hypothetical protein ACP5VQ_05600 [Phycisphaerae bacterium]